MDLVTKKILKSQLRELDLEDSFPYEDIENLFKLIPLGDSNQFMEDLHEYQLLIAGSRSYFLSKYIFRQKLPQQQKHLLRYSFFEMYPKYRVLVPHLDQALRLKKELAVFESARVLMLQLIKTSHGEERVE